MTKESFSYLVANPNEVSREDIAALEALTQEFPYFQLAHTLLAKGYHQNYPEELANEKIRKAAAYSINRNALRKVINGSFVNEVVAVPTVQVDSAYIDKVKEIVEAEEKQSATQALETPVFSNNDLLSQSLSFEDFLIEDILQKQQQQLSIIENFIQKDPGLIRTSKSQLETKNNNEDLSANSVRPKKEIVTESYAKILTMQGRKEKAIAVYEKLILKFPEKKAYFADKIKGLQ
ncbi:hypothetical protein [Flectobacillus major]|uniref:hypothetical protein n=1 Tax=Flectobacillus major TaxID=103 RepID=UPI0004085A89|nr:hypothetical protein [Flectobacillus major]